MRIERAQCARCACCRSGRRRVRNSFFRASQLGRSRTVHYRQLRTICATTAYKFAQPVAFCMIPIAKLGICARISAQHWDTIQDRQTNLYARNKYFIIIKTSVLPQSSRNPPPLRRRIVQNGAPAGVQRHLILHIPTHGLEQLPITVIP